MRRRYVTSLAVLAAFAALPGLATAQSFTPTVEIHGFGTWLYGQTTNDNNYLAGTKEGNYGSENFELNLSTQVNDRLRITLQPSWDADGLGEETQTGMSYAFASWRLNDEASLRIGQVKHPFGLYTETIDVGTLRPFLDVPQAVYGGTGFVGEAYRGLGIGGSHSVGSWTLDYDFYGGAMGILERAGQIDYFLGVTDLPEGTEVEQTRNVLGTRLVGRTPIAGLSFGGSWYRGTLVGGAVETPRWVGAGQLEYLNGPVSFRSEFAHETSRETDGERMLVNGGYTELGYRLGTHWQVAGRYQKLRTDMPDNNVSAAPSLMNHEESNVGLNYWFADNFVIKAQYAGVTGNRYAAPDVTTMRQQIAAGTLNKRTHLVMIGAQVHF